MNMFLQQPNEESKELADLATFISHVADCYPELTEDFPAQITEILEKQAAFVHHGMRMVR